MSRPLLENETSLDNNLLEEFEDHRKKPVKKKRKHKHNRTIRSGIEAYFQHKDFGDEIDSFDNPEEKNDWRN